MMTGVSFVLVRQTDIIELKVPTMAIPSSIKAAVYLSGEGFCQFILHKCTANEISLCNITHKVTPLFSGCT